MTRPTKRSPNSASASPTTRFRKRCCAAWSGASASRLRPLACGLQEHRAGIQLAELRAPGGLILAAHERGNRCWPIHFAREREEVAQVLLHELELELRREVALEHLGQLGLHDARSCCALGKDFQRRVAIEISCF